MDRISKALELARAGKADGRRLAAARGIATPGANSLERPEASAPEFTDTITFRSPIHEIEPALREQERILAPGATGAFGGAYKMLRTQVVKRLGELQANSLAILSPSAAAGKTLTAINLAIAIAAEEARTVLLVDLDLRNPSIHKRFGYEPVVGIEDCLESGRPVQEAMFKVAGYDRLTILPARERVAHSSELLVSKRMVDLVGEMRARYFNRILLFDLPPVLQADDALAFSRLVQAGLMVVSEGRTRREDVRRAINMVGDMKIVGTVLNASRERADAVY